MAQTAILYALAFIVLPLFAVGFAVWLYKICHMALLGLTVVSVGLLIAVPCGAVWYDRANINGEGFFVVISIALAILMACIGGWIVSDES